MKRISCGVSAIIRYKVHLKKNLNLEECRIKDLLYSPHQELRYWELDGGQTLWTINLNFPYTQHKTRVQYSQRPLLQLGKSLYISCGDTVAEVQLQTANDGTKEEQLKIDIARSTQNLDQLDVSAESELEPHQQAAESKIPLRFREGLLDFGHREEDDVFKSFLNDLQKVFSASEVVTERLKDEEEQILNAQPNEENLVTEEQQSTYEWESELFGKPPPPTNLIPINQIKLKELNEMENIKKHVKQGTPTCGLRLIEPSRIDLPKGLPVTSRMRKHGIDCFSSLNEVRSANFDLFTDRMMSLSSERTSLASSVMSYYKKKKLSEKFSKQSNEQAESQSQQLMVSTRSQQSSRKSSLVSLSSRSAESGDGIDLHSLAIPFTK